jgi:hypothetical protein
MDLHPWDLWTHEGEPKEYTPEIVETLERVLAMAPEQPGSEPLLHPHGGGVRATRARDRLGRPPAPARAGSRAPRAHAGAHLHPVGRFEDASKANVAAMKVDRAYRALSPEQGFYRIYMAHNPQFLAFTAMMEGRYAEAREAARTMLAEMPAEFVKENAAFVDPIQALEVEVLVRFGKWEEILKAPEFPDYLPASRAIRHFARGAAFAATGKVADAKAELAALDEATARFADDAIWFNNRRRRCWRSPRRRWRARIAGARDHVEEAVALLREAGKLEDALIYNEPPTGCSRRGIRSGRCCSAPAARRKPRSSTARTWCGTGELVVAVGPEARARDARRDEGGRGGGAAVREGGEARGREDRHDVPVPAGRVSEDFEPFG